MAIGSTSTATEQALALLALLLILSCTNDGQAEDGSLGPSIIGIDHMPTAVKSLDEATAAYRKLGFALKPGRLHEGGIRNSHVKFEDGSGIELISPPGTPADDLSTHYIEFLKLGDGPAYIGLHSRNIEALKRALQSAGFKYNDDSGVLDEPLLDFLFLVQDNRSPTDRPEHFAHANSSFGLTGVWLALDDARREHLERLLTVLGAMKSKTNILAPGSIDAEVFAVQNGRVVVLPKRFQIQNGRPIVGAEFRVRDVAKTACGRLTDETSPAASGSPRRCLVTPSEAHGLWLEFHE